MIRVNVHLPKPLLVKLRKFSKATGLSVAELIRRACDSYHTVPTSAISALSGPKGKR